MTNRDPGRRLPDASSSTGVIDFRPRTAIVLALMTITMAVLGWRIFRASGAPRIEAIASAAIAAYDASPGGDPASSPLEIGEAEKKLLDLSGVAVTLPRDASGLVVTGVRGETIGRRAAAGLRFRFEDGSHLLIVFRQDRILGGKARELFPEESLLSGERDGRSFVFWERDGASYIMVSDVDVVRAFDLVRRFFT